MTWAWARYLQLHPAPVTPQLAGLQIIHHQGWWADMMPVSHIAIVERTNPEGEPSTTVEAVLYDHDNEEFQTYRDWAHCNDRGNAVTFLVEPDRATWESVIGLVTEAEMVLTTRHEEAEERRRVRAQARVAS